MDFSLVPQNLITLIKLVMMLPIAQKNVQMLNMQYMTTNYMYNNTIGGYGNALEQPYFYTGTNGLALKAPILMKAMN